METIHTVDWMKQVARAARAEGRVLGLVPTMGALHAGHLSLVRSAKEQCNPVVVSIFVNPTQFGPHEDLAKYPRQLERDRTLLDALNVDYLFAPGSEEIYPDGFCTYVEVQGLSDRFEGKIRPGHFRGVATIVLKLFEIVQPQFAYFGRKDAQQARIIRQMAGDLNLDTNVVVCPIVREADGLALSSRNAYLTHEQRRAATVLYRALGRARNEILGGVRDAATLVGAMRDVLAREPLAQPEYVEIVDAETLDPVVLLRGACLVLLAVRVGTTRLLDNMLVEQSPGGFTATL
jgi:pantoate--beta-alanine ligase